MTDAVINSGDFFVFYVSIPFTSTGALPPGMGAGQGAVTAGLQLVSVVIME